MTRIIQDASERPVRRRWLTEAKMAAMLPALKEWAAAHPDATAAEMTQALGLPGAGIRQAGSPRSYLGRRAAQEATVVREYVEYALCSARTLSERCVLEALRAGWDTAYRIGRAAGTFVACPLDGSGDMLHGATPDELSVQMHADHIRRFPVTTSLARATA